jgi:hypothetical protein
MSFAEALALQGRAGPYPWVSHRIRKIISGGQTGVDRAALDWAIERGIEHGGWCPQGRLAEDGPIPGRYNLTETDETESWARVQRNVRESDGTVIITFDPKLTGGSQETADYAKKTRRKGLHISGALRYDVGDVLRGFVWMFGLEVVNVAGSRESEEPGIYGFTRDALTRAFPKEW